MKIRRELWFGFALMAVILAGVAWMLISAPTITRGHLGLLMLSLVVVAIMLGFPTAFTLMGMGMIFTWLAYDRDTGKTLTLMVQSAFKVMGNDVLISIPLFVFMGYLVERANLIEKLFRSLHLAMARVPGSLAVATLLTCAVFATATGIVGAVVTLMGLLALPQMLRAGYDVKVSAGVITAGGCLGILIPPSVMLIVYGATAGVSVVQLYAGAFFPGLMLAGLYIGYVIVLARLKPALAPPLSAEARHVALPEHAATLRAALGGRAVVALLRGFGKSSPPTVPQRYLLGQLGIAMAPLLVFLAVGAVAYDFASTPAESAVVDLTPGGVGAPPGAEDADATPSPGLAEPPGAEAVDDGGLKEPPGAEAPSAPGALGRPSSPGAPQSTAVTADGGSAPGSGFWVGAGVAASVLALFYGLLTFERLEIFKMLLASFFPLVLLILAVLGSIVFGLATPTEAAAVGAFGGLALAAAYRQLSVGVVKDSVFLTAKTSAMVCWLFVGSAIFSAAFALLGGQELVERWVLSMELTPTQFLLLSQVIIFVLGWPLEWTEIIVIFMPIFIPLLDKFGIDPLFFGLLVALNLQTAFLSPPVAMAAFYLKGVSPPQVTLNQIFLGMLPFMGIQVLAIAMLYLWPQVGLWLPHLLYK